MEVLDSAVFSASVGMNPHAIRVAAGIYAIVHAGPGMDGFLKTFSVDDSGNIGAISAPLEFDVVGGYVPRIAWIRGNIFAIAYSPDAVIGKLITVDIDNAGNIGGVLSTITFDAVKGFAPFPIRIAEGIVAIAYRGAGDGGFVKTYPISALGIIGALIDTLDIGAAYCSQPFILHIAGIYYAIVFTVALDKGALKTVDIDAAGAIGGVIDTFQYEPTWSNNQEIVHVADDVYAIAYTYFTTTNKAKLTTVTIEDNGQIPAQVPEWKIFANPGQYPSIAALGSNTFVIAYKGAGDDGFAITIPIADDGTIGDVTETLEFDDYSAEETRLTHVTSDVYLVAYWKLNGGGIGTLTTIGTAVGGVVEAMGKARGFDFRGRGFRP